MTYDAEGFLEQKYAGCTSPHYDDDAVDTLRMLIASIANFYRRIAIRRS